MNIHDLIRQALGESDSPDPHIVALKVDQMVGSHQVREVMRELLPDAVREVIRQQRSTAPSGNGTNGKRDLGAMVRDPWRHRVWVPGGGWKFRGDLTADDCDVIAKSYFRRAQEMETHAKQWQLNAQRMRAAGVATLRELSGVTV